MKRLPILLVIILVIVAGCLGTSPAPGNATVPQPPTNTTTTQNPAAPPNQSTSPPATNTTTPPNTPSPATGSVTGVLTAAFVNVGQGDGTVWKLPDGTIIVYDCGPPANSSAENPMVEYLKSIGLEPGAHIHALIASHGHLDHIGGCEEVFADYIVDHVYEAWYEGSDAPTNYTHFIDEVRAEGGVVHTLANVASLEGERVFHQGDSIMLPPSAVQDGMRFQIIWPPGWQGAGWDAVEDSSVVVRWSFGSVDFCTQGDITLEQESSIAAYTPDLNCEIYLMGHHASRYASSAAWLQKMQPKVAIASFGENDYGHPTAEALCRVQEAGAKAFATHRLGTITVQTDGTNITLWPDHPETKDYCAPGASYWEGTGGPPLPQPVPTPTPPGPFTVTAYVNLADPCQYTTVTIFVHAERDNAGVEGLTATSVWHFKTKDSYENGTTDASGDVSLSRYISGAAAGYTVVVEVAISSNEDDATVTVNFTPQAC